MSQEKAEQAIKQLVLSRGPVSGSQEPWPFEGWVMYSRGKVSLDGISSFEPISQFSESEASMIVHFKFRCAYSSNDLALEYIFKKNIDKQWVLISQKAIKGTCDEEYFKDDNLNQVIK